MRAGGALGLLLALGGAVHTFAAPSLPPASSASGMGNGTGSAAGAGASDAGVDLHGASDGGGSAPAEPERFVLVRAGAMLHTALPPAGQSARLPVPTAAVVDAPRASARFRLVRTAGPWVEIETVTDPERGAPHCHAPPSAFAGMALRLFVAADDLQPVTARRVRVAQSGGTLDLEPGVPVTRSGERWRAFPDTNRVPVDLRADDVGTAYRPALSHAIPAGPRVLQPPSKITIGPLKLTPDAERGAVSCDWSAGRDPAGKAYVQKVTPGARPARHRRGADRVRALRRDGRGVDAGRSARPGQTTGQTTASIDSPLRDRGPRNRFSARAGAVVTWPDGAVAGRTASEVLIPPDDSHHDSDSAVDRARPCFDWPAAPQARGPGASLRLCFAVAELIESPAFLSDQQVSLPNARTRRQVAIKIDNHTTRADGLIDSAVRTAARRRLYALGDVVLVPPREESARSVARAQKLGLKSYLVSVRVEEVTSDGGGMTQWSVATKLIRLDGTPAGRTIKADEVQQYHSPADDPHAEALDEAAAFDDLFDVALHQMSTALRADN